MGQVRVRTVEMQVCQVELLKLKGSQGLSPGRCSWQFS